MNFKKSFLLLSCFFISHHAHGMFGFKDTLIAPEMPQHLYDHIDLTVLHGLSNKISETSKSQPTSPASSPRKKSRRNSHPTVQEVRKHIDLP